MDPFNVIVGIATILGVIWVLFAGPRTIAQAVANVRRHQAGHNLAPQSSPDLQPVLAFIDTQVAASRADLLQTVEKRIQELERSHREVQQELARLEQRFPESRRPATVAARLERTRSHSAALREELARLQGGTTDQFAKTRSLVNRQREVEMIRKALLDSTNLRILYFYGDGGIGKTRVLEEAGRLVQVLCSHSRDGERHRVTALLRRLVPWRRQSLQPLAWCGIVDLYHADLHDSFSVQQAIVASADPGGDHFQTYRRLAAEYQQARREGVDSQQLEAIRTRLADAFVQDYNDLAGTKRIVLAFDTLEAIQHESPVVRKVCQIEPDPMAVETWLLLGIGRLKNSAVLLASRPRDDLLDAFAEAYPAPDTFDAKRLTGFNWSETQEYVGWLARQRPEVGVIPKEVLKRLHQATGGLPVRLALTLDLMLDRVLASEATSSTPIDAVLARNLFAGLERDEPLMFYLAVARRGLDAELLHHLQPEWPVSDCRRRLAALHDRVYVKTRPGAEPLFLHDELYALFDQFGPERSKITPLYSRIGEYYRGRQQMLDPERGQEAWQQACANRLYYQLRADPCTGFQSYVRLAEEAVKGHDFGFDMRLRDEMLRFFEDETSQKLAEQQGFTREIFDRDATLRWIRRYIEKGQYVTACQVVRNVRDSDAPLFGAVEPLFSASLHTYYGEATQYLGQALPEALETLNQAVACLSPLEFRDEFQAWWRARILGRALNNIGYIHWQRQCYSLAAASFQSAMQHYRGAGVKDEWADTLNNLAFVSGMLGRFAAAEQGAHKALELRRQLGQRYPLALSLNTLGLIHLGAGRLQEAHKHCADALRIFEELDATRGQGLARIALGQIQRQMAGQCMGAPEATTRLREAEAHLRQAISIFDERVREPLRLVEAANELGCTCRDMGKWAQQAGQPQVAESFYREAQVWLERSITVNEGKWPVLAADACEDLARLYLERGMYAAARQWLERAEEAVPDDYRLQEGKGFPDLQEPVEGFWLALGKIHLLRGHLAFTLVDTIGELYPSLQHYILALSYLERYSPAVPAFRRAQSEVRERLKQLSPGQKEEARQSARLAAQAYQVSADSLSALLD